EFGGSVLPGDDRRQLDEGVVVVVAAESAEQLVRHLASGDGHRVRVLQGEPLGLVVPGTGPVLGEAVDLLRGHAELAAHGSVDVLSELAAVQGGDAAVHESGEATVDPPGGAEPGPHGSRAAEDRRPPGVDEVVQERPTPLPGLRLENVPDVRLDRTRIHPDDPRHLVSSGVTRRPTETRPRPAAPATRYRSRGTPRAPRPPPARAWPGAPRLPARAWCRDVAGAPGSPGGSPGSRRPAPLSTRSPSPCSPLLTRRSILAALATVG